MSQERNFEVKSNPEAGFAVGPCDQTYILANLRQAASHIYEAMLLYSEGHYPHSNARPILENHPLAIALKALEVEDKELCRRTGNLHEPILFQTYQPTHEAMHRWDNDGYFHKE